MKLSVEEKELLPSEEDVVFYRSHGWYISKKIFSDEEIDEALSATERYYAGEKDWEIPVRIKEFLDWNPGKGNILRLNDYIVLQNLEIQKLAFRPILSAIASKLSGSDQIRLFNSSLISKPPQITGDHVKVGWHNDRTYWRTCTSDKMLTAWIPLHDCDEKMGTITMIDGSNLWPSNNIIAQLRHDKSFVSSDVPEIEKRLAKSGMPVRFVPMNMKKGQVSFHHCLTFHGSGLNLSADHRRAVAVHLQDRDNRYRASIGEDGKKYIYNNDLLCRKLADGAPDYSDPYITPILWEGKVD